MNRFQINSARPSFPFWQRRRGRGKHLILGIAVPILLLSLDSLAQEPSYSDQKCEDGFACRVLMNNVPDYVLIEGQVDEVIDGDSVKVRLFLIPGIEYSVTVRIRGIDTPELHGDCEKERQLAAAAKMFVERRLPPTTWVYVNELEYDKYAGRLVGNLYRRMADRELSLGQELVRKKHAVRYNGEGSRHDWCGDEFGEPQ